MNKKTNLWKITTFVLLAILIVESLFVGYIWNIGSESIENDSKCIDKCVDKGYNGYAFDINTDFCHCYLNGEEVYVGYLE